MVSYDDVLLVPLSSSLSSSLDMLPTLSHTSDDCNGAFPAPPKASHDVVGAARVFSKVTVRELLFSRARLICYALTQIVSSPLLWSRSPSVQAQCCPNNFRRQAKEPPLLLVLMGGKSFWVIAAWGDGE